MVVLVPVPYGSGIVRESLSKADNFLHLNGKGNGKTLF